ncbi:MAG: single-stranded-DNA-specific exonuclease RecJ [Methylococcales bacterium]
MPKKIRRRKFELTDQSSLDHLHPVLQRIYQARDIKSENELDHSLARLPDPWLLTGMDVMVEELLTAIEKRKRLVVVADFDADGATSCVVAKLGLELLGMEPVEYVVPNRFKFGYGLTPEIVNVALDKHEKQPDILLTVDNGISSLEGVAAAKDKGLTVLITDHHLPGNELPAADAIVNPNLSNDIFPSKSLAGVGVMFYILMALRARMREQKWFEQHGVSMPNLGQLLDLVALGTVADVVPLDQTNRVLVHQGLQRIKAGRSRPGILALLAAAGRERHNLVATDLGFAIGPRLNAAGRLDDMSLGIECLLADDDNTAKILASKLDGLNKERRELENRMKSEALDHLKRLQQKDDTHLPMGICIFDDGWHQGIIGILAARIKDRTHRPVIAFAPSEEGEIKGSARSIPGVHIRDVLSEIAAARPGLLSKFGGHAMAAGLSLKLSDYPAFSLAFDEIVRRHTEDMDLEQAVYTDGQLDDQQLLLEFAETLQSSGPWGQGFPEPCFDGEFDVLQCRIIGQKHLKFSLRQIACSHMIDAVAFFVDEPESWLGCQKIRTAYRLNVNEYRNNRSAQMMIEYLERI